MFNLFVTISGLVIIINIIYSIIPSEKYANYCKIIIGLITMFAVINIFTGITDWNYDLDYEYKYYQIDDENYQAFDLVLSNNLEDNINDFLTNKFGETIKSVNVELNNENVIEKIKISVDSTQSCDEIANDVAAYCDINRDKVVIEC